jgi:hypothetical protein
MMEVKDKTGQTLLMGDTVEIPPQNKHSFGMTLYGRIVSYHGNGRIFVACPPMAAYDNPELFYIEPTAARFVGRPRPGAEFLEEHIEPVKSEKKTGKVKV